MYRFKVSKYKNVHAHMPRKTEGWITDDINVNNFAIHSNLIKSSASLIAYFGTGGNIGIANINDFQQKPSILRAHGSNLSDLDFSPFDDGILASASTSGQISLWQFTQLSPEIVIPHNSILTTDCPEPVVLIQFHKTVETLLSFGTKTQLKVFDINKRQTIVESTKCSQIQSIDTKYDGKLYALTDAESTGTQIKIWDPRIDGSKPFPIEFTAHDSDRDSRVIWLGDKPNVISCGFNKRKAREAHLWDTRSFQKPITSVNEFQHSTGVWIPLYDFDTQLLFIAGRNDSAINHWEANDLINGSAQFDNNGVTKKSTDLLIKGATIAPKRALNIMETEVNRIVLLGADNIAPVSYSVPRKSYREFHSDLFPETKSPDSAINLKDWLEMNDNNIPTICLNPNINKREKLVRLGKTLGSDLKIESSDQEVDNFLTICEKDGIDVDASLKNLMENPKSNDSEYILDNKPKNCPKVEPIITAPKPQPQRRGFTIRTTKFRHLKGTIAGRETHITNFSGLSKTIPGDCDGFKTNSQFCAVPIGPTCNQLAVLSVTKGKRLTGGVIPHLVCGHSISDFAFDPFDENKIAVGCDNGTVQFWTIPEKGLTENLSEFEAKLVAHNDRITIIAYHPNAQNILTTFAVDLDLIIWNIETKEPKLIIRGHSEPLFGLSWSPDGALLATLSKDQKLRIFDPRDGQKLIAEGLATQGSRGGRVCWAQNGSLVIVTGFSRVSERQFLVFNKNDLSKPIATEGLDVSPAILIPFYDEDSSTLFLTGKGDSTVFTFEISSPTDSAPYIHHLSHYNTPTPHQSIAYVYKRFCDVRSVEFARGYRLTTSSIEPISFAVPRLRTEYFQDDLFPETKAVWKPSLTSEEWFGGQNGKTEYISLKPDDMSLLSEAQPPAPQKKESNNKDSLPIQFDGDIPLQSSLAFLSGGRRKQEMITQQMSEKVLFKDEGLPQENWEGVDPQEWDE